jgi:hypothetical protein
MKLYEMICSGVPASSNALAGSDACLLVRASTLEIAAGLADVALAKLFSAPAPHHANRAHCIGTDTSGTTDARVLRGPHFQLATNWGWPAWERESDTAHWEFAGR